METLSNRKLLVFGAVLLLVQIAFFLIGGLVGKSSQIYWHGCPTAYSHPVTNSPHLQINLPQVNMGRVVQC